MHGASDVGTEAGASSAAANRVVATTPAGAAAPADEGLPFEVEETTVAAVHAAMSAGQLTCRRLVAAYLARLEAYSTNGPRLNVMISVDPRALERADALDREFRATGRLRPLHGIPVTLKDSIDTADLPTTAGSAVLRDAIPARDAFLVRKLREAGAVILGKNTLGDLSGASYSTVVGIPRNPYDTGRMPGGSSSGSGVAVAANLTLVAVGEDTMTSVRTPAALTGVVGFRPTTGLISASGIVPRKAGIDTAGPLARTVADAARLLDVVAGPDPDDPGSLRTFDRYPAGDKREGGYATFLDRLDPDALRGARIGIARDFFGGDPEIDRLAEDAVDAMAALGAELVDVRFDPAFFATYVRDALQTLTPVLMYPFKALFEGYLALQGPAVPKTVESWIALYETTIRNSAFPPETSRPSQALPVLVESLKHSADDDAYRTMVDEVLPMLTRRKRAVFAEHRVEALVMPYQPTFAEPIATPLEQRHDPAFVAAPGRPAPNTIAGYGSEGFPMIVVPMGFGTRGLPMGLAIMGEPYRDGRILSLAYAYEQATRHRRPPRCAPSLDGRRPTT